MDKQRHGESALFGALFLLVAALTAGIGLSATAGSAGSHRAPSTTVSFEGAPMPAPGVPNVDPELQRLDRTDAHHG
jgi:hypothetical protein